MRDTNEDYWDVWKGVLGALIVLAIFIMFFLTGCKTARNLKKSTSDSTEVHKSTEVISKSDSSGSKTESTKETVFYPQPIYIQGKDGETKVVFVPQSTKETGKTEQVQVVRDESWRAAFDSLNVSIKALSDNKKTKVGPSVIEWILIAGLGLLLIKNFLPFTITKK